MAPLYYGQSSPISIQIGQKKLCHYCRENLIYKSPAVNFLFFFAHCICQLPDICLIIACQMLCAAWQAFCKQAITKYSGQKKKVNGPEGAKCFFLDERGKFFLAPLYYGQSSPISIQIGQKKLCHYCRENLIYKSPAVNFLFFFAHCICQLPDICLIIACQMLCAAWQAFCKQVSTTCRASTMQLTGRLKQMANA